MEGGSGQEGGVAAPEPPQQRQARDRGKRRDGEENDPAHRLGGIA